MSQMVGMLIGGLLFGVLADKRGRLSVLMASILLYSLMNIANAFVSSVPMYALFRFLSGIGLAGELGVAITLVAEIMPVHRRGYGTTIVAATGILGAVAAYLVHEMFAWRAAFVVGGILGLMLLVLRVRINESHLFDAVKHGTVSKGNVFMLFKKHRIGHYLAAAAIGVPIWYVIGLLVTFAPQFAKEQGTMEVIVAGKCVMWAYVGLAAGDLVSGLISQWLKSRKRTVVLFLTLLAGVIAYYLLAGPHTPTAVYVLTGLLGFASGYWAVFVTTAAEQFGTNLRATVATTVPNIVRGSLTLILFGFSSLRHTFAGEPLVMTTSAVIVGVAVMIVAYTGWLFLRETYGRDLNYLELD
jgi:predicted MFS family arabinose efflux permease